MSQLMPKNRSDSVTSGKLKGIGNMLQAKGSLKTDSLLRQGRIFRVKNDILLSTCIEVCVLPAKRDELCCPASDLLGLADASDPAGILVPKYRGRVR